MEKYVIKALKDKQALAKSYNVPVSAVIWIGNNHYIVVKYKDTEHFCALSWDL